MLQLLRAHILVPGYPLTNSWWVPGYQFIGCGVGQGFQLGDFNVYAGTISSAQVMQLLAGSKVPVSGSTGNLLVPDSCLAC